MAAPFLASHAEGTMCLLCKKVIGDKEKSVTFGSSGLSTIKEKASVWANLQVPDDDEPYHEFTCVQDRLTNVTTTTFQAHSTCRVMFGTRLERKQKQYAVTLDTGVDMHTDMDIESDTKEVEQDEKHNERRSSGRIVNKTNYMCFICNNKTNADTKPYADGGLGRCSEDRAFHKLHDQINLSDVPGDKFEGAAKRLKLLLSGQSFDVFAVDVYYLKTMWKHESECMSNRGSNQVWVFFLTKIARRNI